MDQVRIDIPEIKPLPEGDLEIITTHANMDFDALASMLAVSKFYPNALLVQPGSQERSLQNFFLNSTVYLFNFAKIKDVDLKRVKRLILVDTRQPSRIGGLKKILKNKGLELHIYDHHPPAPGDLKGDLEIVAPVGATVTIMTEIMRARGIKISPEEATVMALGVHEDTGSLVFATTTSRDYRAVAFLLEQGADLKVVEEMITHELTSEQVALLNELITSLHTETINGRDITLAHVVTDHYVSDFAVLVHRLMDMENLKVLFALAQMNDHTYVVARSRVPDVDVGEVARSFGGGGHASAASANVKNQTLNQVEDDLLALLKTKIKPTQKARDIMVFPIISIPPDQNLEAARDLFTRYNINVLLVMNEGGPVLGFISRQNVSKALHHRLIDVPVHEFMTTEFNFVGPQAGFAEIIPYIVEQKQRVLPVIENGKPLGVITRTDLLNILASEANVTEPEIDDEVSSRPGRRKNIASLMRERLPSEIIDLLFELGRTADQLEYSIYAVGGFIRDIFIRQHNLDIDVVVEGDGIKFAQAFVEKHPEVRIRAHHKFNTAVLIFPDGFKVDVATARLEYYESPASLPVVEASSLRMDLYRRDFTINTLAVKLNEGQFGTLIDYFRAMKDIKDGFIRVLHNLSFVEDPTRVFRAIRFEQRFGFKIGKVTLNLIQNAAKHNFFQKLSRRRLFGELKLILQEDDPVPAIARLAELDLLKFIYPDLSFNKRKADLFSRIKRVRDWFDLTYFGEDYQAWKIYFLGLLDGLKHEDLILVCDQLVLVKRDRSLVLEEKPEADHILNRIHRQGESRPGRLYILLNPLSTEVVLFLMAKTNRESTRRAISSYFTKLKGVKTELSGQDLIDLNLTPGPRFKEIFDALIEARLNGQVKTLEDEKQFVIQHFVNP